MSVSSLRFVSSVHFFHNFSALGEVGGGEKVVNRWDNDVYSRANYVYCCENYVYSRRSKNYTRFYPSEDAQNICLRFRLEFIAYGELCRVAV